jgi:predicted Holliday junction resolvase-like endonuclease
MYENSWFANMKTTHTYYIAQSPTPTSIPSLPSGQTQNSFGADDIVTLIVGVLGALALVFAAWVTRRGNYKLEQQRRQMEELKLEHSRELEKEQRQHDLMLEKVKAENEQRLEEIRLSSESQKSRDDSRRQFIGTWRNILAMDGLWKILLAPYYRALHYSLLSSDDSRKYLELVEEFLRDWNRLTDEIPPEFVETYFILNRDSKHRADVKEAIFDAYYKQTKEGLLRLNQLQQPLRDHLLTHLAKLEKDWELL